MTDWGDQGSDKWGGNKTMHFVTDCVDHRSDKWGGKKQIRLGIVYRIRWAMDQTNGLVIRLYISCQIGWAMTQTNWMVISKMPESLLCLLVQMLTKIRFLIDVKQK